MTMNFKYHVIQSVIDIVSFCGEKMIELAKEKKIIPEKYEWWLPDVIPLMPIVEVNHCLTILYMSKKMVHIYTTENTIHQFAISYIINPSLSINRVFREQVQKCLGFYFFINTMKTIRYCLLKNNTSVMAIILIYENSGKYIGKVYRVLSFFLLIFS